jgi:hypothetical protein
MCGNETKSAQVLFVGKVTKQNQGGFEQNLADFPEPLIKNCHSMQNIFNAAVV